MSKRSQVRTLHSAYFFAGLVNKIQFDKLVICTRYSFFACHIHVFYVSLTLDDFDFKPRRVSGLYHVHAKPTNAVQMEFKCARVFFRVR